MRTAQTPAHPKKPGTSPENLPTAAESPDMVAFRHLVAAQANEGQKAQFGEVVRTMRVAIEQANRLQRGTATDMSDAELSRSATDLRDAVYDAQHENFLLMKSLSDTQEAELKKLTAKLRKANQTVGKASDAINDEMARRRPRAKRVAGESATLRKELLAMQSDQRNLGLEMGIKRAQLDQESTPSDDQ